MTFLEMQTLLRFFLGEDSEGNYSTTMLKILLNQSAREIRNLIIGQNEDYFATSTTFDFVSGTETYALPAGGVQRILLVTYTKGTIKRPLRRIPIRRKTEFYTAQPASTDAVQAYFMQANLIGFASIPRETRASAVRMDYVAPMADLVADGDLLPGEWTAQQHELVVHGGLIRAVMRNKELIPVYQPNFDRLYKALIDDMSNRDSQDPKVITDVYGDE
jgi:hypothetical protein